MVVSHWRPEVMLFLGNTDIPTPNPARTFDFEEGRDLRWSRGKVQFVEFLEKPKLNSPQLE